MMYDRVIPRDLFNESKLLKCLGQLCLLIHTGKAPAVLSCEHDTEHYDGFAMDQDPASGDLFCSNLKFFVGEWELRLQSNYNSKSPYPLTATFLDSGEHVVFNDDGTLHAEFLVLVEPGLYNGRTQSDACTTGDP